MKSLVVVLALVALFVSLVAADEAVVTLTNKNFQKVVKGNEFVLVEFYAPWCGHCKALAPEYEEAAKALEKQGIVLGKVDATVETELAEQFELQGYPTLKFFKQGEASEYTGGRQAADIIKWVQKKTGPPAATLNSDEAVRAFVAKNDNAVIGYFAKRTAAYKQFIRVAEEQEKFAFAEVVNAEAADAAGIKQLPTVVFHRPAELGAPVQFTGGDEGDIDRQELTAWLKQNSLPLVGQIGPETFTDYFDSGLPLFLTFLDLDDDDQKTSFIDAMKPLAEKFRGKHNFGFCDGKMFADQAKRFGAKGNVPDLAYLNFPKSINLGYDGDKLTVESLVQWVGDVDSGKVKWQPKSEPEPESQSGPVFDAVGTNIEATVNQDKDVFVMFYAPWCGHCKSMKPAFEELGAKFAGSKTLQIARINADDNDVAHVVSLTGFPTLALYRRDSKGKAVMYSGDRTVEAMSAWLMENCASRPTGKDEL